MNVVRVESERGIASLLLDRPSSRNALSIEMCDEMVDALAQIETDPSARVVVVRGAGSAFCAGADLGVVSGPGALKFLPAFERMLEALARHRLPTIAAIHGAALGGGLQLATVCDFRIATREAKLGIPSSKLGILVNFENIQRLVLLAGPPVAKDVLMAGRIYDGAEAHRAGLVHAAVPASVFDDEVDAMAARIAALAPLSVQGAKWSIQVVLDHLSQARKARPGTVEELDRLVRDVYHSEDLQEGLKAMSEKREPRFKGK